MPNCKVYKKEDIPDEYHWKNNRRIAPVVVVADNGWMIQTNGSYPYTEPLGRFFIFINQSILFIHSAVIMRHLNFSWNAWLQ